MAATSSRAPDETARRAPHAGIVTFAGVMLVLVGSFNLLDGVVAIANDDYYRVTQLLFGDLTVWGVWWLFVGAAQVITGYGVITRSAWGFVVGVGLASINAFTQLMFLGVYPAWSIAIMILDVVIIYALIAHSDEAD